MKAVSLLIFLLVSTSLFAQLRINEVQINNSTTLSDFQGDYEDWIEIRNTSASAINLNGFFLSDDPATPNKWSFPLVSIPANSYLLIFASSKNISSPELHSNFKLSQGEKLFFFSPTLTLIDTLTLPECPNNYSYGRMTNGNYAYFGSPTPGAANSTTPYWGFLYPPSISVNSGYYSDSIVVSLSHYDTTAILRYTLDGSEPTANSPIYSSPLVFKSRAGEANKFSMIPTNPSFTYPVGQYDSLRANNRGWLPPYSEVFKANTLRAKAFGTGLPSEIISRTYIVTPLLSARYSLPVLSVIADSADFFSDDRGIYVYGNSPIGNYNEETPDWERPVYVEYFDANGNCLLATNCGVEMHGGGGRHSTQKNLELIFRDNYNTSTVNVNLYPNQAQNAYSRLYVRTGGHRPDCIPRDDLAAKIVGRLPFDYMSQQQCIVLLNGEYWGIHSIKEIFNTSHLSSKYKIPNSEITIVDYEGKLLNENYPDSLRFKDLMDFVNLSDMTQSNNYNYVKTQMDIDSYISYMCAEIFMGNGDWPNSNTKVWRKSISTFQPNAPYGHDGRWRWMFYDLDGAYGGTCNGVFVTMNGVQQATLTTSLFNNSTKLFRGLLTNNEFKIAFINRMCDLLNSWFKTNRVQQFINELNATLSPEMLEHVERWRYPSLANTLAARASEVPSLTKWNQIIADLDSFAIRRPGYQRLHLKNYFSLVDSSLLTIDVNDSIMGMVKLNSILLNKDLPGLTGSTYPFVGKYFEALPIPLQAIPLPGYQFKEWLGTGITNPNISVTINGDTTFTALFEIDTTYNPLMQLKINELMAKNETVIRDEFNEYDDWFELYNPSDSAIDLLNYYVSDNPLQLTKFQIIAGDSSTIMPPKSFKLFWADGQFAQGNLHTNFSFSSNGEQLFLVAPDGITIVDSVTFPAMVKDVSYGRLPNGGPNWQWFYFTTPNMSNELTSVDELQHNLIELIAYPNPNNEGIIHINVRDDYALYDINGKCLGNYKQVTSIPISHLQNGIYFLRNPNNQSVKFIKF